jgi:diguanylate cyclase (GGDEF)-like protein/hemerythrin-like metal-binding protein
MDTTTLAFTVALVGIALALSTMIFALYRRERGFSIYASGFLSAVVSFLLFTGQGSMHRSISLVLANMLLLFFQLCLPWGLRSHSGIHPGWPIRFWLYTASWFAVVVLASTVIDSFTVRAAFSSLFIIVASVEFLLAFSRIGGKVPRVVSTTSWTVVSAFIVFHAVRVVMILAFTGSRTRLMDDNAVNIYTFSFTLFFSVLWAGLVLIIDAAGLLAQLEAKNRTLEEMATSDKLRGLLNRHSLDTMLASEMERSQRYREPLSIILFDIDHFKHINDSWGHPAGDEVLKRMSAIASNLVREPDNLFRWGGEEFLLVAPHTMLQGAIVLADKLRQAIAAEAFPSIGAVTASFGAAEWLPDETREDWFKRVDQALYRAKNTGRNRVVGFGAQDALPLARVSIEWRPEWESGNRVIDEEHRMLVDLSNNLFDVTMSGRTVPVTLEAVDALIGHVSIHFGDEEKILAEAAYPDLAEHAGLHRGLVQAALDLRARVDAGTIDSSTLFNFLVDKVVIGHMIQADTKFFEYTRRVPEAVGVR